MSALSYEPYPSTVLYGSTGAQQSGVRPGRAQNTTKLLARNMPHRTKHLIHDNDSAQRLIEAAGQIFAEHGYHGARVRDIVRAADVNLAAVNYYFGGKEGLYAATITELAAKRLAEWPKPIDGEDPEATLFRCIKQTLERVLELEHRSTLSRIIAHESMKPTPYFEKLVAEIIRPQLEAFSSLATKIGGGNLDKEKADAAASSILGQCLFFLLARGAVERIYPAFLERRNADALARHVTAFSIGGIAELLPSAAAHYFEHT